MTSSDLELDSPCPVALDRELSDGRYRSWKCGHCDTAVHVLSSMTEKNARKFLEEHEGEELCITYMVGRDGDIRFQPEPKVVPVSRLRRRAVAGVGLAAALAACTPSSAAEPPPKPVAELADTVADTSADKSAEPAPTPKVIDSKPSMTALVAQARDKAAEQEAARKAEAVLITEKEKAGPPIADVEAMPMPGGMMVPPTPPPTPTTKIAHRRGGKRIKRVK